MESRGRAWEGMGGHGRAGYHRMQFVQSLCVQGQCRSAQVAIWEAAALAIGLCYILNIIVCNMPRCDGHN